MHNGKYSIPPGLLGFLTSCYHVGSVIGVPIAPWINQKFGRRWTIMGGSLIMCAGAIIQGFAQHGMLFSSRGQLQTNFFSRYVHRGPYSSWIWTCPMYYIRVSNDWGTCIPKGETNSNVTVQCLLACRFNYSRSYQYSNNNWSRWRLGLAGSIASSNMSFAPADYICLVSSGSLWISWDDSPSSLSYG